MDRPKLLAITAAAMLANMKPERPVARYREDESKSGKKRDRAKIKAARNQKKAAR